MLKIFALFLIVVSQTACASKMLSKILPQEGKEIKKVERVKSVAIIAYDTLEYHPSGLASKVVPMMGSAQSVSNLVPTKSELSLRLYNDLAEELRRKKFKVLPLEKVRGNSYYKGVLVEMKDVSSKVALRESQKPTIVEGIARSVNPKYQFSEEQRKQLTKELGVDAVVFARVTYHADSDTDFVGLGLTKSYLQPVFSFYMFGGKNSEMIWFASGHVGPRSKKSLGRISGLEDKTVIAKMSRPLAKQAMRDFLDRKSFNK